MAAPYHLDPARGPQPGLDGYGRTDNPTWRALEKAIGELEGGDCVVFATGMAAVTAVLLTELKPGDAVVVPGDGYYKTRAFATSFLAERGVTVLQRPTSDPRTEASLILIETPANPGLDVCDIAEVSKANAIVAVDNTT